MKHISLFLLLILILTSCSKHTVEKKIVYNKPIPLKKTIPVTISVISPVIIPVTISVISPVIIPVIVPGTVSETIIQKAEKKYDKSVRNRYEAFNAKLHELQSSSTEVKLKEINNFFNNVPFDYDIKIWDKKDYWATPLEFLGKDKGDCEDYVIAKYFSLRSLGIESEKLCLSYVKSKRFKRIHMVLSYFETPSSTPLILDSLNFKIFPADKREDLIPIYNFNGESLYRSGQKGQRGQQVMSFANNKKFYKKWEKLITDIETNKL